jgi:UDP-glucose:glycoprotein glucosyltransferase
LASIPHRQRHNWEPRQHHPPAGLHPGLQRNAHWDNAARQRNDADADAAAWTHPRALFRWLPPSAILTAKLHVPEPWNVQTAAADVDLDNMKLAGLPAAAAASTAVSYVLKDLLVAGQCLDVRSRAFPNGLQLTLRPADEAPDARTEPASDTLVMQNLGYWQLKAQPGLWRLQLAAGRASALYRILNPSGGGNASASVAAAAAAAAAGDGGAAALAALSKRDRKALLRAYARAEKAQRRAAQQQRVAAAEAYLRQHGGGAAAATAEGGEGERESKRKRKKRAKDKERKATRRSGGSDSSSGS